MKKLLLLMPVMLLLVGTAVQAQDPFPLPTVPPHSSPPYVYHFDPMPPKVDWHFPANAWPNYVWNDNFSDALNAITQPWHWETEWRNPNPTSINIGIIFNYPGVSQAGRLTLGPGASAVIEWITNEVPEVGRWTFTCTPPMTGINPPTDVDASICEGPDCLPTLPPTWHDAPLDSIEAEPHFEVTIAPPTPTLSNWGIIILVLLLLISAALILRRRRTEA